MNISVEHLLRNIEKALDDFQVPGLSVAVVKDDEIIFSGGYGVRRLGEVQRVDEHTVFACGSISKSFTALGLAMLVGEQKLGWDDPVTKYLPDFQLYDAYVTREITIRDLLTHRCGLADVSGGTLWYGSTYDRREVIRRLRNLKPVSSFRSRFAYQNVMYLVAGEIIPAITGISWDDFVRQRIFEPLGMHASSTDAAGWESSVNKAAPHVRVSGRVLPVAYRNYDNVGPAASINTSAFDLAQYARLYLKNGSYAGQELLPPQLTAELVSPQMTIPIEPGPDELKAQTPNFYAYGLGWFLMDYHGRKLVRHTGGVDGYRALIAMQPEEQLGVVVLANQEEPITKMVSYQLIDAFIGLPASDWCAAYLAVRQSDLQEERNAQAEIEEKRSGGTQPSLPLEAYAGNYQDVLYGEATIFYEDGRLVLSFSQTPSFTGDLQHWHYDTFRIHWRDPVVKSGLLTFNLDARGQVSEIKFEQPNLLDVDFSELNFKQAG